MRAAIEAFDAGSNVALLSKIHPTRSHSGAAEGGINAALGNASEDNPELHAYDTVKGSDYLADQDAVEILCNEAPGDVYELENWGAVFSRTDDGRHRPAALRRRRRAAHRVRSRHHRARADPGALRAGGQARRSPSTTSSSPGSSSRTSGRCVGVIAWDLLHGGLKAISAKTTILATGGAGRLYVGTTNAYACTGDGMTLALRAGVALKDMEMMQFHPTTLAPTGVLITEGCRGEGAFLLNKDGERFLKRYAPNAMELASRDVISRAEQTEIDEGRGSTATCCSTCATSAPRRSSSGCTERVSCRWCSPASTRSTSRSRCGRAPTTTWAASTPTSGGAPRSRASTPPARSRASRCTARTGSAATR